MKKMIKLLPVFLAIIIACGRSGVEPPADATNEDAIYNIIRFDSPSAFSLDLFDLSVPDTSLGLLTEYQPVYWWHTVGHDSLDIDIRIFEPQPGDTSGAVPYANVRVAKYFWGTLEVIALDTAGGSPQRVRFSKSFGMLGVINSVFEKVGFDYNTRRGWRFMQISDAVFTSLSQTVPPPPPTVEIQTADSLIRVNPAIKLLRYIPQFTPGESVTVSIYPIDTSSVVSIRYPSGAGYATQLPRREAGGVFRAGFSFPRHEEFGHFLVDIINPAVLSDSTTRYFPNSLGVLYRAR